MSRILIVEDERPLFRALGSHLQARGYEVDLVETGEEALSRGATSPYDAAVVDLGLPGIDGMEVVHGLRGWTSIPIIVLSARDQGAQKIMALDAGADDYVTKPFNMGEFLARLRAALRRAKPTDEVLPIVETPDFRIDLSTKRATNAAGREIKLTPTQWHLVEILVRNPDRLVSQRQLLEEVWGPTYTSQTNYLRQFMAQLRAKFEPDRAHPRYFLTEPGLGVRFVAAECEPEPIESITGGRAARLRSSTLTAGSPRMPRVRSSVCALTSRSTVERGRCRSRATRGAWSLAFATVIAGSRPLPEAVTASTGTGTSGLRPFSLR